MLLMAPAYEADTVKHRHTLPASHTMTFLPFSDRESF